jgi:hypothetical protein
VNSSDEDENLFEPLLWGSTTACVVISYPLLFSPYRRSGPERSGAAKHRIIDGSVATSLNQIPTNQPTNHINPTTQHSPCNTHANQTKRPRGLRPRQAERLHGVLRAAASAEEGGGAAAGAGQVCEGEGGGGGEDEAAAWGGGGGCVGWVGAWVWGEGRKEGGDFVSWWLPVRCFGGGEEGSCTPRIRPCPHTCTHTRGRRLSPTSGAAATAAATTAGAAAAHIFYPDGAARASTTTTAGGHCGGSRRGAGAGAGGHQQSAGLDA